MEQVKEDRFVFQVEWFDKQADLIRNYLLTFYPGDSSIDMVSFESLHVTKRYTEHNLTLLFFSTAISTI